jgi:prepilin-type N-terminal cleavage/methylation domain-containing protein
MSPSLNNFAVNRISKGAVVSKGIRQNGGARGWTRAGQQRAFTLIELLAVIAIIALLAGIVLTTAGTAIGRSRDSRIRTEKDRLVTAIEDYKAVMGNYPPDNQDSTLRVDDPKQYHERCGRNSLFYELSGCTFDNANGGTFTTQNKAESVKASDLRTAFGAKGVENSARNKRDIPYKGVSFKPSSFAELDKYPGVQILIVPVDKGPFTEDAKGGRKVNPWFYDASSTNRHNMETYDLWSEYAGRDGKSNVIGNWKE